MKLHELHSIIVEAVMDQLSLALSRAMVNHLKANIKKKVIPPFEAMAGDLSVIAKFLRGNGPPRAARSLFGKTSDGDTGLELNFMVPVTFDESILSELIPIIKGTLSHELEHYRQYQRSGGTSTRQGVAYSNPEYSGNEPQKGVDAFSNPKSATNYFLAPHEIEAHVMELYKKAKTTKMPLSTLIIQKTREIAQKLQSNMVPKLAAQKVAQAIQQGWMDYAKTRLPTAG